MVNKKLLFILLIFIASCTGNKSVKKVNNSFDISIMQNGQIIEIVDNTAVIKRNNFSVIIKFRNPDGILINASFNPESYNNAIIGNPLSELKGFKSTGIADVLFNPEGSLFISDEAPNYWYYTNENDHRFNSVTKLETEIICQRDIKKIINIDDNSETDIINLEKDGIYLVFIKSYWSEDFTKQVETARKTLQIKFSI